MLNFDVLNPPTFWTNYQGDKVYYWAYDTKMEMVKDYARAFFSNEKCVITKTLFKIDSIGLIIKFNKRDIKFTTYNGNFEYSIYYINQFEITDEFIIINKFIAVRYKK